MFYTASNAKKGTQEGLYAFALRYDYFLRYIESRIMMAVSKCEYEVYISNNEVYEKYIGKFDNKHCCRVFMNKVARYLELEGYKTVIDDSDYAFTGLTISWK